MEADTEANIDEPFEENIKQVDVKPIKLTQRWVLLYKVNSS